MLSPISIVAFVLMYTGALSGQIQPLTRTPVQPYSINKGYVTDYKFSVDIPSEILSSGSIELEFSDLYQISSNCRAHISIDYEDFELYSCTKTSPRQYMIEIGYIPPGEYQIVVEGITNPTLSQSSANFKIRTWINENILVDTNEFLEGVPFIDYPGKRDVFFLFLKIWRS